LSKLHGLREVLSLTHSELHVARQLALAGALAGLALAAGRSWGWGCGVVYLNIVLAGTVVVCHSTIYI